MIWLTTVALAGGGIATASQRPAVNPQTGVLQTFQAALQQYLDVRQKAVSHFQPLKPDADQATIATREKALGEAIRTARTGAHAGEIFTKEVAPVFRAAVKADFKRRSPKGKQLRLDELPHFQPVVNQTYPSNWPLQTFPPTLLAELPKLPEQVEYRFVDNALILRDKQANIVIDYLIDVM